MSDDISSQENDSVVVVVVVVVVSFNAQYLVSFPFFHAERSIHEKAEDRSRNGWILFSNGC